MGLIDSWNPTAILVRPRTGYSDAGEATFGTAVTVRAAVRSKSRQVRDDKGQTYDSDTTVYVPSTTAVAAGCQVSLDGGTTYRDARRVETHRNLLGVIDHYEVVL